MTRTLSSTSVAGDGRWWLSVGAVVDCIRNSSISSLSSRLANCSVTYLIETVPDVEIHGPIDLETMHVIPKRHDCSSQYGPRYLMVVRILGVQLNAVRSPPHEYTVRTRQQSVAHGLDVFGNTDVRCVQELKDAEAWDGAGHCEGDVSFGTRGTPDLRMSVGAEDREGMKESAWVEAGDETTAVQ